MQKISPFIHLRTKSAYSILEGALSISLLSELCLEKHMPALALTDNNLFGALEFACQLTQKGIQPIHGCTFSVCIEKKYGQMQEAEGELVLLAQNEKGYKRLLVLSSQAYLTCGESAVIMLPLEEIMKDTSGLILLTGGTKGILNQLIIKNQKKQAEGILKKLSEGYPGRVYIELQRHGLNIEEKTEPVLTEWADCMGLPLVATNNASFAEKEMYEAQDVLLAILESTYISVEDRKKNTAEHYFKSGSEMEALFKDLPEAIENTLEIAKRCSFWATGLDPILPGFPCSDNRNENEELEEQARKGLALRLQTIKKVEKETEYYNRLDLELEIIKNMGFAGYFLIVSDFIKWAKENKIPVGPGRGSGAGSVVAWALSITNLDPLRFGLLFERFLNPERVSMPDFDIDFCQEKRDLVIEYVREKYGTERVAHIITFGTLQARAVVRDVGRVMQLPLGLVDRLAKMIPNNPAAPTNLKQALEIEPRLQQAAKDDPDVKHMLEIALKLEGLYRNASTHAAGVVIADRPLTELVPLYKDARSNLPATQFSMKYAEKAGLVKFDFLGLKTLTVIDHCLQYLKKRGIEIDLDTLSLKDPKTYEMLGEGNSVGVFQLESTGMRETLKKMKPDSLEDLIALISLYRPGPMKNIDVYIERKFGHTDPDYLHPSLEPVLKETYGVIIYQEQVMQIAQILSGYSLGEADLLRRAMGKKQKEEMAKQKSRFIEGAKNKKVLPEQADYIFELVSEFAGYGFNKSHAAAYALIAYQTAWLKANYPVEFLAALMSLELNNTEKLTRFVLEAKKLNIKIIPPDINICSANFDIKEESILYALGAIRNVSMAAMESIDKIRNQDGKFKDIIDFAERVDPKCLNKRALENLASSGAFDCLQITRSDAFCAAESLSAISAIASEEKGSSQGSLFGKKVKPVLPKTKPWSLSYQLDRECSAVGFYLSGHPLDNIIESLQEKNITLFIDAENKVHRGNSVLRLAGIVRKKQERISKKTGDKFAFLELSDPTGTYEVFVSPEILKQNRDLMRSGESIVLSVRSDLKDGDIRFFAEKIQKLDDLLTLGNEALTFHIYSLEAYQALQNYAQNTYNKREIARGVWKVKLRINEGYETELFLGNSFPIDSECCRYFRDIDGIREVHVS